jgi:hypothetical protein
MSIQDPNDRDQGPRAASVPTAPAIRTSMGDVRACSRPMTWRGRTFACELPAQHEGVCQATLSVTKAKGAEAIELGHLPDPPASFTWDDVVTAIEAGEIDMDDRAMLLRTLDAVEKPGMPAAGSPELHAELAAPDGSEDKTWSEIQAAMDAPSPIGIARGVREGADDLLRRQRDALNEGAAMLIAQGFTPAELEVVHETGAMAQDFTIAQRAYVRVRSDRAVAEAAGEIDRARRRALFMADALTRAALDLGEQQRAWQTLAENVGPAARDTIARAWAEHADRASRRAARALDEAQHAGMHPSRDRADMAEAISEGTRIAAEQRDRIEDLERQLEHERALPALDRERIASVHASELAAQGEQIHALADQAAGLADQLEPAIAALRWVSSNGDPESMLRADKALEQVGKAVLT